MNDDLKHLIVVIEYIKRIEAEFLKKKCEEISFDFDYQRFMLKVLEPVKI